MKIPNFDEELSIEQINLLTAFAKSCRHTSIAMLKNSQSGHPGGSLSSMDYLATLYSFIISQTGHPVIVSNGHISPAVYSVLAELEYINKEEVIQNFRKVGSVFEGHITRQVPGIYYGTGPLGIGVSVATAFALAEKLKDSKKKVYALMGDGEAEEGQVYEALNFANKYKLDNLVLFVDYNEVQLTASLAEIMPLDLRAIFEAANWQVLEINGHNYAEIWGALRAAQNSPGPVVILGHTIMGKGVDFMEKEGLEYKSTWHGNAPKPEQADEALKQLELSKEEEKILANFKKQVKWKPEDPHFPSPLSTNHYPLETGSPILYGTDKLTDCRTAYGKALLDLAKLNKNILAISADLRGSVMTKFVAEELPAQHIEVGIAEQQMVSLAGGLSLNGFVPFCSTFGAFMSSRAKDQARVNDINKTNVKMVATHCGLSVGEDGPTHQAIDDMGSFLGMFNTMIIEPVDPNHTDRIIRYIASHYGNFYVRMGRHKIPVITKEDGSIFYDENYEYEYGKCDVIREGTDLTIVASGSMVAEALEAIKTCKKSVELVAVSSIKKFDDTLLKSIKKTGKVLTVEDHNTYSGLASQISQYLVNKGACPLVFKSLGVTAYQLSGKYNELYEKAGIGKEAIRERCNDIN
ncbi:MAG: transketolase [Candidatus Gracilibacteria bacterium]|nr:transketolase [Candidatus Gracilibacteria bacterium]